MPLISFLSATWKKFLNFKSILSDFALQQHEVKSPDDNIKKLGIKVFRDYEVNLYKKLVSVPMKFYG